MKKYVLIALIPIIWFACGVPQEDYDKLQAEKDSLLQLANSQGESVDGFLDAFSEIENNLATIKDKENIIRKQATDEADQNAKDRINEDILLIYKLMQENKQKVAQLTAQLNTTGGKSTQLQALVDNLTRQMAEKEQELLALRDELAKKNIAIANLSDQVNQLSGNVDSLSEQTQQMTDVISDQTIALNTAYYVFGTKKELLDNNVITKTGGFVGIGRIETLRKDFDKEYFTEIDIRNIKTIQIMSKKAELVTTHPAGSYEFKGTEPVESLIIKNPKEFWSVSKYLVILVEN